MCGYTSEDNAEKMKTEKLVNEDLIGCHTRKENFPVADYRFHLLLQTKGNVKFIPTVDNVKENIR